MIKRIHEFKFCNILNVSSGPELVWMYIISMFINMFDHLNNKPIVNYVFFITLIYCIYLLIVIFYNNAYIHTYNISPSLDSMLLNQYCGYFCIYKTVSVHRININISSV